jgi:hypothetical protein
MTWLEHLYLLCLLGLALWFPCCTGGPPPCPKCSVDAETVTITYGGFADGYCDCTSLNASFVLTRSEDWSCLWIYRGTLACGSGSPLQVEIRAWAMINTLNGQWCWHVEFVLSGHIADMVHIWNSGDTVPFDCTATRVAAYSHHHTYSAWCTNWANVTCQIN